MRTRLFALALCAVFPLCAACSGSTNRTPSIRTTMTPPQEYRQEENLPNNPGSLFAASDSDTLFSDSRARRIQTASLASLRLDAALAAMLHCSREEAAQLVHTGKVQANHLEMTSPHAAIYEGDIFTIRGKGRFRLESIGGKSRRDRIFIQYYQYE